jgi:hypothetical protein
MLEKNTGKINILGTPTRLDWFCATIVALSGKRIR